MTDESMIRVCLKLHYVGTNFHGWQVQPDVRTVQGELEAVLERITGAHRTVVGSGRTDTGVHATGQIAAVDLPASWSTYRLQRAFDGLLPDDVWVEEARIVAAGFHPRFDAVRRSYRYHIGVDRAAASPFRRGVCWPLLEALDLGAMELATAAIVGDHSFFAFAKAGQEERGDRCRVEAARWERWDDLGLTFRITADRYLHHMVRYLVGTLVDVGRGRRPGSEVAELLSDPTGGLVTSPPAPPEGLFLDLVEYPEGAFDPPSDIDETSDTIASDTPLESPRSPTR